MRHIIKKFSTRYPYSSTIFCIFIILWICVVLFFGYVYLLSQNEKQDLVRLNTETCNFSFLGTKKGFLVHQNMSETPLFIKEVSTPEAMQKGLGGIPCLKEDEGMLFVFSKPDIYSFWMKDMLFPIDIIWIDEDKKVISIDRGISPETFPKTFSPKTPALYVLEVSKDFSRKHTVRVGDTLKY